MDPCFLAWCIFSFVPVGTPIHSSEAVFFFTPTVTPGEFGPLLPAALNEPRSGDWAYRKASSYHKAAWSRSRLPEPPAKVAISPQTAASRLPLACGIVSYELARRVSNSEASPEGDHDLQSSVRWGCDNLSNGCSLLFCWFPIIGEGNQEMREE